MGREKSIREQRDKCRHFTGLGNGPDGGRVARGCGRGECAANVRYDDVAKQGRRMIALPCFREEPDNLPADGAWPTCPKVSWKTPEELDREEREIEEMVSAAMLRLTVARPAILRHAGLVERAVDPDLVPPDYGTTLDGVTHLDPKLEDKSGTFPCPVCKTGELSYAVSGYNGHVAARCTTEGCCNWME